MEYYTDNYWSDGDGRFSPMNIIGLMGARILTVGKVIIMEMEKTCMNSSY